MNSPRSESLTLEEIVNLANQVGLEYVEAKQEFERYDLLKSTIRAQTMEKYDDGRASEAKIRRLAEMDSDYVSFLEKMVESKAKAERLRVRYDSYRNLFEARRSMLSYKKAEMRLT